MKRARQFVVQHALECAVLGAFGLVVLFVNPLRETVTDDDWAYALTVRHLLETGSYQLHDWAAANLPFQAYWGALFARLFGYSFSSLRVSTLFMAALGSIAFYWLAKEHGLDHAQAGLLTLSLLASPLVLCLSFTFMTDIPFLACLIIALYLYTRAIRLHSYPLMVLASMAAAAAILTRQSGLALIGGLLFLWVLSKGRKQQALFFLSGLTLPVVAGLWQLAAGILRPTWGAQYAAHLQSQYLANPGTMLAEMLWRPTVILQYLALFSLPLVFLALVTPVLDALSILAAPVRRLLLAVLILVGLAVSSLPLIANWIAIGQSGFGLAQTLMLIGGICLSMVSWWLLRSAHEFNQVALRTPDSRPLPQEGVRSTYPQEGVRSTYKRDVILLGVFAIYIVAGILYGHLKGLPVLLPYLPWFFGILQSMGRFARGTLTLVTSLGAILFARIFIVRYRDSQGWGRVPPSERLIDLVTLFLFLQELAYGQIGDRYILVLLPFTLIVVGRHLRSWFGRFRITAAIACVALLTLAASAMWTRGSLASAEAYWQGGEFALSTGAQPRDVFGSWTWLGYYRFSDCLAEVRDRTVESIEDCFFRQRKQAQFWITETLDAPSDEKWEALKEIPYRGILLREGRVYVLRRENKED